MPKAFVNGVHLDYQVTGSGVPLVFAHEFAGDARSWDAQVKFFARRYQVITYNARGYPPSEVPTDPAAYSQEMAVEDLAQLLRHLKLPPAHLCGLSMGAYAVLHLGLKHPELARSLVVAGCGYGADPAQRAKFQQDCEQVAARIDREGMRVVAKSYAVGPTRVQFEQKDPVGWQEFLEELARHSDAGSALTLRGFQMRRPSIYDFREPLQRLQVPTLIMTGDEDDPCLEPALFLKRQIPSAALLVLSRTGHAINQEEPEAFNRAILDFFTTVDAGRWTLRDPRSVAASAILAAEQR